MKKQLFSLLSILSLCLGIQAQVTVTLGSGTLTVLSDASSTPISRYYENTHFQVVYTAAEIAAQGGGAGNITKLGWYIQTASAGLTNYTVRMAHTTATTSATHNTATLTTVYGPTTYNPIAGGFDLLTLTSPFNWDGVSNILIDVCITGAPYTTPYGTIRAFGNTIANGSRYIQDDNAGSNCGTITSNTNSYKPQISFEMAPAPAFCFAPGSVTVSGISTSTVNFSWAAPSILPASGYSWIIVPANAGTTVTPIASGTVAAGTLTVNASGLSANTSYDFYVQSICGIGDFSTWTPVTNFVTPCNAVNIPYTQDFESAVIPNLPSCTSVENVGTGNVWTVASPTSNGFNSKTLRYLYHSTNPANTWFYTQGLNLTTGVSYRITYRYGTSDATSVEKLKINYGTSASAMTNTIANHAAITNTVATTNFVDFTPSSTGVYYIGFNAYSTANQWSLFVDDIYVEVTPTCFPPTALTTTNVTTSSVDLSWTAPSVGTPALYEYEIRTSGAAGSGTLGLATTGTLAAASQSLIFSGLVSSSSYSAYVRTNCGGLDNSAWSTAKTFTSPALATDLQALSLQSPIVSATGCYATHTVTVRVKNLGTSVLDFSTNNATVTSSITGPNPQTYTTIVSSGTLATNATLDVVLSTSYNMSAAGVYTFDAGVTLATPDANTTNNVISAVTRTTSLATSAPQQVSFVGYTGTPTSLNSAFSGWTEGTGAVTPVVGGDGLFTSSSVAQNALYSEGAKMNLYASNTSWIISPKFIPTANTAVTYKATLVDYDATTAASFGVNDSVKAMISANCGVSWTTLRAFNTTTDQGLNSSTNVLRNYTESLSAYAGQPVLFAIYARRGVSSTSPDIDIFIDDINIASCFPTTSLTLNNILQTTADLSWSIPANGSPVNYIYEVRTSGAVGSGTTGLITTGTVSAPTTSVSLAGLAPLTSYSAYIKTDCGSGDYSPWSSVKTFTTLANCGIPLTISTASISGYSATFSWGVPSTGVPSSYSYEVRTSGSAGSGTLGLVSTGTVVGTNTMVTVSTLTPTTNYSVYLQTDCGSSLLSNWTAPSTFTTGVSCPATSTIAISAITPTSAVATWTAGGAETSWYVQYASPTTTATVGTPSHTLTPLTPSTNYTVSVKALCTSTNDSSVWVVKQFMTPCQPSDITGVGNTRCGIGSSSLTATSTSTSAIIQWYNAPTGGSAIATGTVYTTPTITANTTYYATSTDGVSVESVGRAAPTVSVGYLDVNTGLVFSAISNFVIQSTVIYPVGTGAVVVALQNSTGTEISSTGSFTVSGNGSTPVILPINLTVVPGTGYRLVIKSYTGITDLVRQSGIGGYPYSSPSGAMSITNGYFLGTSTSYYYFYNIQISSGCESARVPVTATVTAPPVLALTTGTTVCANVVTPLTITSNVSDYNSYVWSPNTNLYTDAAATNAYTGGGATTVYYKSLAADTKMYTVNATNTVSACANIATTTIMTDLPNILASVNPSVICSASTVSLNATTNAVVTGTSAVGTGTGTSALSPASPFNGSYGGMKGQYLISANDLIASGLNAGNITSLSLNVTSAGAALQNFAISIGTTTLNAFAASTDIQSGLSSVYTTTLFTPVVGNNVFVFSTPFNWDGTSNIIVSTCWSNNNTSNTSSTVKTTTTPYLSAQSWLRDSQTSSVVCGLTGTVSTGGGSTSSTRPQFVFGGQVNGQGIGNLSWIWNPGAINSNTAVVNPINSGSTSVNQSYTITAVNPLTTCSNTATVNVTINPVPVAVVANNSTQCGYGVPTASVTGAGGTYNWYNAAASGTLVQSGTSVTYTTPINGTTTFYVSEKNTNCEGPLTAITITVTTPDAISTSISSSTICPAQSVTLTASNTGTTNVYVYTWYSAANNGIPASVTGATAVATPSLSGVYVYSVTGTDGACTAIATTSLNVATIPSILATANPNTICSGASVSLNADNAGITTGTLGVGTATTLTGQITQPTAFCNRWSSYRMQTIYTAAELTTAGLGAGNITSIAYNITTLGDATTNANYSVKCGTTAVAVFTNFIPNTSFTTVFPATTYTHAVGVNTITFTTPYYWDGVSNLVIEVNHDGANAINNAQTYYTTTLGNTLVYSTNGATTGTPSNNRLNIVFSGQVVTQFGGALTWQWNPGAINSNTVVVNPTNTNLVPTTTSYTVTAIDPATTCSNTAAVTITVNPIPTVTATTTNSVVCAGSSATLQASGAASSFSWAPQGGSTATAVVTPTANTTYTVTGLGFGGCTATTTLALASVPIPTLVATAASTTALCAGSAVVLNTSGTATSFTWAPTGGNSATATVTPNTNTTFTVTGSDGICTDKKTVSVSVIAAPVVTATSSSSVICAGNAAILTASTSATSYTWSSNAGGVTTLSVSVTPSITTNYTVTANNGTCTAQAAVSVSVNPCTGIEELTNNGILVYPNPSSGIVNIAVTNALITNVKVELYDAIGKLVMRETLVKETTSLNITKLEDGVYFFKIISNNQDVKIGKLIKQ